MGKNTKDPIRRTNQKNIPATRAVHTKSIVSQQFSTDGACQIWCFAHRDREGKFRIDVDREDLDHKLIVEKMLEYNCRTWGEIMSDRHGFKNKSCHHMLSFDGISPEGKERIQKKGLLDRTDSIYSHRLDGKTRLIGYRDGPIFFIIWYDPNHEFYPRDK